MRGRRIGKTSLAGTVLGAERLLGLLLVLACLMAPSSQASAAGTMAVVRAGGAEVCDAPQGACSQELARGTRLDAIGRTDGGEWIEVTVPDGGSAWVLRSELVLFGWSDLPVTSEWRPAGTASDAVGTSSTGSTGEASAGVQVSGQVSSGARRLNVRSAAGTTAPVTGSLGDGDAIVAVGRDASGSWLQIEGSGSSTVQGWVSSQYVVLDGDAGQLPVTAQAVAAAATPPAPVSAAPVTGLAGRLVFQASSGGTIYVYDLATGALRALTTGADPAVSPDGQSVLFWREVDGQHAIYRVGIDGSGETLVVQRGEMLRSPGWSPDGGAVVINRVTGSRSCRDAGYGFCFPDVPPYSYVLPLKTVDAWGLSVVDIDGSDFRDLAAQPNSFAPDWGADGVLYQSDGGLQITSAGDGADDNRVLLGQYRYRDPEWQPGGDRIVFQSLEKDHWEIYSATAGGENVTALTRPATTLEALPHNVAPTWSPDGKSIVFLSNRSGAWALWVMDAGGANQRQLPIDITFDYRYQSEQVVSWGKE